MSFDQAACVTAINRINIAHLPCPLGAPPRLVQGLQSGGKRGEGGAEGLLVEGSGGRVAPACGDGAGGKKGVVVVQGQGIGCGAGSGGWVASGGMREITPVRNVAGRSFHGTMPFSDLA